ncbi:NAD(P)-dependent oxidoreductase [Sulfitobacter sp. EhC04]|uniref:SDR family oxidoreductase n=1 Tax=Sulfitobacter sp. EhC04 TaxID=1849168 RepID=UPI0007F3E863|nr:SDR family oxidoreductase [Sulfitobacter sp. EhC04]OAN78288.1 NAD(P)-dependent oxidoreductase [Sulfitobacter sp. EhC04]
MSSKTILVTGASGQLGQRVLDHLKRLAPDAAIAGLVRKEEDAAALRARGVEPRMGDYTDPASLSHAMAGVHKVLLISSSAVGQRTAQHQNVIDAARAADVDLIAYTSILRADTSPMALAEEHKQTEAALSGSGLPTVLLRNGWYTENLLGGLESDLKLGQHFGAAGNGKFATATRDDYAEAAAVALLSAESAGKVYELAGQPAYTLEEFAETLSAEAGSTVAYVDMPQETFAQALVGAGLPEGFAGILADSDAQAAKGALDTDSTDLEDLIGRPATPLKDAIKAALAAR